MSEINKTIQLFNMVWAFLKECGVKDRVKLVEKTMDFIKRFMEMIPKSGPVWIWRYKLDPIQYWWKYSTTTGDITEDITPTTYHILADGKSTAYTIGDNGIET